jgi:hypothetical protein
MCVKKEIKKHDLNIKHTLIFNYYSFKFSNNSKITFYYFLHIG